MNIGSNPCEQSLGAILEEIDSKYITKIVTNHLQEFKISCKCILEHLAPHSLFHAQHFLKLSRDDFLLRISSQKGKVPFHCYSHWRACITADYRNTLRLMKKVHNPDKDGKK